MQVKTLLKDLEENKETVTEVLLKDIELADEGLKVTGFEDVLPFDTQAESLMATMLGINGGYLKKCPVDLKKANINFWLGQKANASVNLHTVGNRVEGIHDTDFKFIPMRPTMEKVAGAFDPEDEVKMCRMDKGYLHLDLLSQSNHITVPGLGTDHRPMDDITHGGIRFFMYPQNENPPKLQTYLHRLICSNGLAVDEPEFTVHLRGNTVPEIIEELEGAAKRLMGNMGDRLEAYRKSSEAPIEGDLAMFIHQYAADRGLPARVASRVMDTLPVVGDTPTAYDITQLFTSLANDENIRYTTQLRLQEAGGNLALKTEAALHRCTKCERTL